MTAAHNSSNETRAELADRVAETVLQHPSVLRLHGGEFGVIATPLPGRRVTGVRTGAPGEPIEVSVTLRLDRPLPEIISELRHRVAMVAGDVAIDITVSDVVTTEEEHGTEREADS
ncbi:hypothetical protein [Haloactinomyces albus]|uniref:GGDEF domain-containing protein n=1 Tax=Haloactinomyces albus TaxID=1352928 RepID=A0AAE3ZFZ8_9ACTN|nr:hypothetical protein [Haloactinomyces albus]MDR7303196.1 GGDEF domain-containing protein [Haloactinomyces albus]